MHAHAHERDRLSADRRVLAAAMVLVVGFMGLEVVAGVLAGSLALLADAGHMLSDAAALGLALFAATFAGRPAHGGWTFGFRRLEILAAQANGIVLVLVGLAVVAGAVFRLLEPTDVDGVVVLIVSLAGMGVMLLATLLLSRASRESLNVRGAFLHLATDLAAFAGTAAAGGIVLATGWDRADPVASLLVATLAFWAGAGLVRDSTRILLEMSPRDIDPVDVGRAIVSVPEVVEAHDVHVWTVTSGFPALSAHVLVAAEADCHAVRRRIEAELRERFRLDHTTLQVDHVGARTSPALELGPSYRRSAPLGGR